ncbi:centrosomal protein of 128 kDa-like isoform X2 [Dunckerocampus dactyliophorus]|uniref:centrosomal protein of 128 kDa-like isoform X2 n=1 Tax=Dunckerocampus dactyliophorus TaxID=161453 RepID=UPI002406A4E0|nr:centrosomal protein of 128 kDa-like isoform X2 [Dunckerocampus dactyliophorus]
MDTSSGSDSYDRRGHRPQGRESHRRPGRERGRASGRAADGRASDISEKISTLCDTLQDTNRNLSKVDQMLGQYREYTDDQAQAMALLRDNLEESISQLQAQRLSRTNRTHSASASSLHSSDLDACPGSDGHHFQPTSPLRDYTGTSGRRRRSHSASVRFKNSSLSGEDIHVLHQSLRDLRCDQQRLSVDLDREILRRKRSDVDTRRTIESLSEHMTTTQRLDSTLERDNVQAHEREEPMTYRQHSAEKEKLKMEQELERARRLLEQSEDSRESLVQQVEDMRVELQRTRKEKTELQRIWLQPPQPTHGNYTGKDEGTLRDALALEKEVAELRAQLHKTSTNSEIQELKKAVDRKERERVQLSLQLEGLSADMARREQRQVRMLEQLRDIQSREQAERTETEALLQESTRSRDELKARAQKAVRQWRAKCNRLQKELEEARAHIELHSDKAVQVAKEKESSQTQLKALSQQAEAARRELAENLRRLAQREEELHRKDVEMSETCQRQLALEQEIREVKEASAALQTEARRQSDIHSRLREENLRLVEKADAQARLCQRDQNKQAELQGKLTQMTSAHAQLAQRLTEEEASKKELHKVTVELQAKLAGAQEERDTLRQQLQLEREVHEKELGNLKAMIEDGRTKNKEMQEMIWVCRQEREEIQAHLTDFKAGATSDKKLCEALRVKLDRMKDECDKLAAQLSAKEDAHALLHKKYQLLELELDEVRSNEGRRASVSELVKLEEKVAQMEAEHAAALSSIGDELDVALHGLDRNGEDNFQSKLRRLREEVQERDTREQRLRRQSQHTRDELKALRHTRDADRDTLLQRLEQQEKLLHSISTEKKELLEGSRKKDEAMRSLQDRVLDLELSTKAAMEYWKSMTQKQYLMDNFKDLEESQRQKEVVEQCYTKHKEIVWDLQHQLDESKRKIQEYREEKLDASSRSMRVAAMSSSMKSPITFLSSSVRADTMSPHKRLTAFDLDDSAVNMAQFHADPLQLDHK